MIQLLLSVLGAAFYPLIIMPSVSGLDTFAILLTVAKYTLETH